MSATGVRQECDRSATGVRKECDRSAAEVRKSATGVRQECAELELRGAPGVRQVFDYGVRQV